VNPRKPHALVKAFIHLLGAFFLPADAVDAADIPALRVMSFNIRYGTADDGPNAWTHRKDLVVQTIRSFNPDLLGTQETLPFQAQFITAELPEYSTIGWTRDENRNGEQCTIFYRTDRFDLVESGQFWLSETPDHKYSKSWDSSLPRVAAWVLLRDTKGSSKEFVFSNTHFDHRGSKARHESAKLIHERARARNGFPIILTGDFNCPEGSIPWSALTSSKLLRDTRRLVHPQAQNEEGTFNGFKGPAGSSRVDWILATDHYDVLSADIDRTHDNGRYPSDHFPVTTVLKQVE
jgi:endonuclease/exonuclease/phosphatase family metal-dependent hydrolase